MQLFLLLIILNKSNWPRASVEKFRLLKYESMFSELGVLQAELFLSRGAAWQMRRLEEK